MDVIANIQMYKSLLTKNELKACEAVCSDLVMVQTLSLNELSEKIGVTKTTILRFCQKLGYSGYSEFRYDVIRSVNQHKEEKSSESENSMQIVEDAYCRTIQLIHNTVNEAKVKKLIDLTQKYRKVYVAGEINSAVSALQFRYSLLMFGIDVSFLPSAADVKAVDLTVNKNDLIILYTVSGRSGITTEVKALKQNSHIRTMVITMNAKVEEEQWCDDCIVLPSLAVSSKSLLENVPIFSVFNEIVVYYASKGAEKE